MASIPGGVIGIFMDFILPPGIDSAYKRNEYQGFLLRGKGGRSLELTTLPSSRTEGLDILGVYTPGDLRACPDLYRDCLICLQY